MINNLVIKLIFTVFYSEFYIKFHYLLASNVAVIIMWLQFQSFVSFFFFLCKHSVLYLSLIFFIWVFFIQFTTYLAISVWWLCPSVLGCFSFFFFSFFFFEEFVFRERVWVGEKGRGKETISRSFHARMEPIWDLILQHRDHDLSWN